MIGFRLAVAILAILFPGIVPAQGQETPRVFRDCPDCPEMVEIPPGRFIMGVPPGEEEFLLNLENIPRDGTPRVADDCNAGRSA